jgi:hypothetical protein
VLHWLTDFSESLGLTATSILLTLGLAALLALVSVGFVTALVILMPANYFLERSERGLWVDRHPVVRWTLIVLKNLVGVILVIGGVVMLFGPGQGVLTILIGVMLLDFPGKRKLELYLVSRPRVLEAINRLRARFGRPPMLLPDESPSARELPAVPSSVGTSSSADCDGQAPGANSQAASPPERDEERSPVNRCP